MVLKVGIVGGGQLGRMLIQSGINYDIEFRVLSSDKGDFPSQNICRSYSRTKSLNDYDSVVNFGLGCDVITIEIENCNVDALEDLQKKHDKRVIPDPSIIRMIQSKVAQKDFLSTNNFSTAEYYNYSNSQNINSLWVGDSIKALLGFPCINKMDRGGYDGYGVQVIDNEETELFENGFLEKMIDFDKEIGITIARNDKGEISLTPVCEMVFNEQNMLDYLVAPASKISRNDIMLINEMARKLANDLNLVGIMSIELFWKEGMPVWINELSPRPHNSAHYTMDGCTVSQYDLLIHCLLDLSLPSCELLYPSVSTINILGNMEKEIESSDYSNKKSSSFKYEGINELHEYCNQNPNLMCFVHLYGKSEVRPFRKMGHVNLIDATTEGMLECIDKFRSKLCCRADVGRQIKNDSNANNSSSQNNNAKIAVIMGSQSDWNVMKDAVEMVSKFEIEYEVKIVSAHRTPRMMMDYASSARDRGIRVIIAGAGGAAHLPGMVASLTTLPVIGVPVKSSNSIDGWDSVLSILQMPSGVPVATVALNGAKNAGILACQIIGVMENNDVNERMIEYKKELEEKVLFTKIP